MATTPPPTTLPPGEPLSGTITYYHTSPLEVELEIVGSWLNQTIWPDPIEVEIEITGSFVLGVTLYDAIIEVELSIVGRAIVGRSKCNWVKWSKIGKLNFTIDESNVAGERPLDWPGCVYKLLKLGKSVIAYGTNGVTALTPSGVAYGIDTVHRLGLKSRNAAAGTDSNHWFVDSINKLYSLSMKGLELLDYSEYISRLGNTKLSFDQELGLLYICDGVTGFVYSTGSGSFGEGPKNITDIGSRSGVLYVVAPSQIRTPKFHIRTDIYDFGVRKPKTIQMVEVGTDLTDKLQVMVETRMSNKDNFIDSMWKIVNPNGIANIPAYGVEFRFHVRSYIYEYLELDYLKVVGVVHGFRYIDTFDMRR